MANGKTHEKINLFFLALGVAVVMTVINKDLFLEGVFVILGYIFGTYLMSPDLDLKSRPYRRWGVLRFIWLPYQTFKHRSIFTHGFIISDIIRYAYLTSWYILFLYIFSLATDFTFKEMIGFSKIFFIQNKTLFFSLVFGNMLSSISHTLTDRTFSAFKRLF